MKDEGLIITLHERSGRIAWVNQTLPSMKLENVIGTWPWEWLEGADREAAKSNFAKCIALQEPQTLSVVALVEGRRLKMQVRIEPIGGTTFPIIATTRLIDERVSLLSPRERQIALLSAEGFSAKDIGRKLGISASTVDTHRHRARAKLRLPSLGALELFALRNISDESFQ